MLTGILLAAAMSAGPAPSNAITLGQWAKADPMTRRLSMVGAMEGVLLASSALGGIKVPVNPDCFSTETPVTLENHLLARAAISPNLDLAHGLVQLSECAPKRGAR